MIFLWSMSLNVLRATSEKMPCKALSKKFAILFHQHFYTIHRFSALFAQKKCLILCEKEMLMKLIVVTRGNLITPFFILLDCSDIDWVGCCPLSGPRSIFSAYSLKIPLLHFKTIFFSFKSLYLSNTNFIASKPQII